MSFLEIIGLIFVMIFLPILIGWIIIHSTINFWRKLKEKAYFIMVFAWVLAMFIIYQFKVYIITYKLNYSYIFQILGIIVILLAFYIDIKGAKVFNIKQLIGMPELFYNKTNKKKQIKQELITKGIYMRIRHPRYFSYILLFFGIALLTRLLSLFILFPIFVLLIYFLILSEEKELKNRFKNYKEYRKNVPMLIPRIK